MTEYGTLSGRDILIEVARHLNVRSAGRMRRVNRAFYALIDPACYCSERELARLRRITALRYRNPMWELITKYPDKPWDWFGVSKNPNITLEIVLVNPSLLWYWKGVSKNPNITLEMVLANPTIKWDWYGISKNPNITLDMYWQTPHCRGTGNVWAIIQTLRLT